MTDVDYVLMKSEVDELHAIVADCSGEYIRYSERDHAAVGSREPAVGLMSRNDINPVGFLSGADAAVISSLVSLADDILHCKDLRSHMECVGVISLDDPLKVFKENEYSDMSPVDLEILEDFVSRASGEWDEGSPITLSVASTWYELLSGLMQVIKYGSRLLKAACAEELLTGIDALAGN